MPEQNVRKLYRSGVDRMAAGVCGGVAEYISADPTIIRIIWILASLFNGIGVVAYLLCLLLIPENPAHASLPESEKKKHRDKSLFIGTALIAIGLLFFFRNGFIFRFGFDWPFLPLHWDYFWPILLIAFGAWYIYYSLKKEKSSAQNDSNAETTTPRRFMRSKDERMIGGVCGGLADLWGIDVTIIRVGYALITLFTHIVPGIVAYIVFLIAVPEKIEQMIEKKEKAPAKKRTVTKKVEPKQDNL